MQYYAKFQGFLMSNMLLKDTQPLTTHILQLQTIYLKHPIIIQCNTKSQGFFNVQYVSNGHPTLDYSFFIAICM